MGREQNGLRGSEILENEISGYCGNFNEFELIRTEIILSQASLQTSKTQEIKKGMFSEGAREIERERERERKKKPLREGKREDESGTSTMKRDKWIMVRQMNVNKRGQSRLTSTN